MACSQCVQGSIRRGANRYDRIAGSDAVTCSGGDSSHPGTSRSRVHSACADYTPLAVTCTVTLHNLAQKSESLRLHSRQGNPRYGYGTLHRAGRAAHAFSQACAVSSPFSRSMSAAGIFHQLTPRHATWARMQGSGERTEADPELRALGGGVTYFSSGTILLIPWLEMSHRHVIKDATNFGLTRARLHDCRPGSEIPDSYVISKIRDLTRRARWPFR